MSEIYNSYDRSQAEDFQRYVGARVLNLDIPALKHNRFAREHDALMGMGSGRQSSTVIGSGLDHYRRNVAEQLQQTERQHGQE